MVAVATLRDEGAADVARELLEERGIEVELREVAPNRYFGAPTAVEIEVRVPTDRIADARAALAALEGELEAAAVAEAGVERADDEHPGEALPAAEERPKKISWAIALALIFPVPFLPVGMIYARAPKLLPLAIVAASLGLLAVGNLTRDWGLIDLGMGLVFVGVRVIDAIVSPIFVARWNRRLAKKGTADAHA
jgi:hypothetical protein